MSNTPLIVEEKLLPGQNYLAIVARDRHSRRLVASHAAKNIVVNAGRSWLRGQLGVSSYQNAEAGPCYPGQDGSAWTVDDAIQPPFTNYRLRFMALGTGGMYAAAGTFQESVHVSTLETPVALDEAETEWLKEMLPSPDATDEEVFPTAYDFVARCVWDSEDISYGVDIEVAVSEIMICTSQADATAALAPDLANYPSGFPGIAAYNCFAPITKSQDIVLEAFWFWRY